MRKNILPFLTSLVLLLAVSGCTLPGGGSTGGRGGGSQGVAIENFESDFSKIYSEEEFKLQMMMRNIGDVDVFLKRLLRRLPIKVDNMPR